MEVGLGRVPIALPQVSSNYCDDMDESEDKLVIGVPDLHSSTPSIYHAQKKAPIMLESAGMIRSLFDN